MTNIYIDLSRLCLTPFTTGIQRVAKEIVLRMLQDSSVSVTLLATLPSQTAWRVLPHEAFIRYYTEKTGSPYGEGRPQILTPDDIPSGAVFFDIDSAWNMPMHRGWLFPKLKARAVTVVPHLYDLIPVTDPQYFHEQTMRQFLSWVTAVLQYADHIICNAEATKAALHTLCESLELRTPACSVVPLGADFAKKAADADDADTALLEQLPQYRYLLMVGTIEPRKNHRLLLDAVPELAKRGIKVVFAGRIGWNMDAFAKEMAKHPEKDKNFFFAQGPTDATIQALYRNALAVAFPTKNEGFGLPIVEAYMNGTPVLASDIPVLREVGGSLADYFDNTSIDSLLAAVDRLASDEAAYQQKRAEIAAYRPRTWDTAAAEMTAALKSCGSMQGTLSSDIRISQMVVLTARNEDLLRTLPYLDANMPFVERLLVICPQRNVSELKAAWQGRIRLDFFTDEELLAGESLPEDHTTRNFYLRCLLMQKAPLDDVFIMTDDDYRPLVQVTEDFFLQSGRYQAYYCYDLRQWRGTQGNYTSYDRSMFRTRDFLAAQHLPALQYSSHQPQVIDRKLYLEMLAANPDIQMSGLDEWSSYFNWCIAKYPARFAARRYCSACWPGSVSDWQLWCEPESLVFENFYDALYDENRVFAGLPKEYDPESHARESAEKIRRWSAELAKQRAEHAAMQTYTEMYRDRYGRLPEFLLTAADGEPVLNIPALLYLPTGAVIRLPLLTDDAARSLTEPVIYSIDDENGRHIMQPREVIPAEVDAGVPPELILPLPPYAFRGILTLRCGESTANCALSCAG